MSRSQFIKRYVLSLEKDARGWYLFHSWVLSTRYPLSNRHMLSLQFSRHNGDRWRSDEIYPHLLVYPKWSFQRRSWSKEGTSTGPLGVQTWDALRELWPVAEDEIGRRLVRRNRGANLIVTGSTPRLFRIYSRFLEGREKYHVYGDEIVRRFHRV